MRKVLIGVFILFCCSLLQAAEKTTPTTWRIQGHLNEACTCDVPCNCNFGKEPSPNHFCWALVSMDIKKGKYGKTNLEGLKFGSASAKNGTVFYIDQRATKAQRDALEAISKAMMAKLVGFYKGIDPAIVEDPQFQFVGIEPTQIVHQVSAKGFKTQLGTMGGFDAENLIGLDGKTPIKLINNWSWNITNNIKAKTGEFHYADKHGNEFDMKDRNANQGLFDWSDKTAIYFR